MREGFQFRSGETLRQVCKEPFRVFFPLGLFLGLAGVSLWPLYYLTGEIPYPGVTHARLMIEGFMASFIFGFLGTAGPRLTSVPHFTLLEVWSLFTIQFLAAGFHAGGANQIGDAVFSAGLLLFTVSLVKRFRLRQDSPPPNFILVGLGIMSGIAGSALVSYSAQAQYSVVYQFGSALLNQCFVLFPILGVAPFFIRRLLNLAAPVTSESGASRQIWRRQAGFSVATGLTIIGSFAFGIGNESKLWNWVRVFAIVLYLVVQVPFRVRSLLADGLRTGLLCIIAGYAVMAWLPQYRVGGLHLVFITGFNLIVLSVATRVIFGHSGNANLLQQRLLFFVVTSVLLFIAAVARLAAELVPAGRATHLVSASISWLVAMLIWIPKVVPKISTFELERPWHEAAPGTDHPPDESRQK